ncbi:EF-hand calcium-binding domain-containing protein 4B-like [Lytechinus variegatus]|uniref:EF-hand calcium-binding domain-containing protein 4B-like n=1 Tax=Lytechinus variegatus TaxID=7654 RepID=UPI001BB18797|nr:EF-hand calcium-binding domain-containing protein 4B-like [Lytechinus variegatus]XP_041466191.1 EF-hand calcium-binding domain-containing protein 4B-like [Lytechinus variegatus]
MDCTVFEHSPSMDDISDSELQLEWDQLLQEIGGTALLAGYDELYELWQKLRHDEPELLVTFQNFLRKAVSEIKKINDSCDNAVRSKNGIHADDMRRLYEEMEQLLTQERETLRRKYRQEMEMELERLMDEKDQEVHDLIVRKRELELSLQELDKKEKEKHTHNNQLEQMVMELSRHEANIVAENEGLVKENSQLRFRLDQSLAGLNETQQLCLQLQEETERERAFIEREYAEAVKEQDRKSRDRHNLELQLEKLREKYEQLVEDNYSVKEPKRVGVMQMSRVSSYSDCECDQQMQFLQLRTPDRCFKVVMCGDSGVGKSSFVQRFCHNSFSVNTQVTIEIGFHMKSLVLDNTVVSLQIWDTAGQERFRSIPHAYFRKADGVLLLYDISCEKSFLNVQSWIASIREHDDNAVIMLTGNKEDLASPYREVPRDAALKVARENNALFIETSAKNGTNVFEAFGRLARELQKKEDDNVSRVYDMDIEEQIITFAPKKKRKCCNF